VSDGSVDSLYYGVLVRLVGLTEVWGDVVLIEECVEILIVELLICVDVGGVAKFLE